MVKKPEIVFLNKPSPERIFRAWAEIEAARMGTRVVNMHPAEKKKEGTA